jgi:hypothetical protein
LVFRRSPKKKEKKREVPVIEILDDVGDDSDDFVCGRKRHEIRGTIGKMPLRFDAASGRVMSQMNDGFGEFSGDCQDMPHHLVRHQDVN